LLLSAKRRAMIRNRGIGWYNAKPRGKSGLRKKSVA
jgi:hypothetical protein